MLESDRLTYQKLRSRADGMLAALPTASTDRVELAELRSRFAELQQHFQEQVLNLDLSALESSVASLFGSLHTEMSKQLRLLSMDLMFLQTARQPETVQQRASQMSDRLRLLMSYCDAVLEKE